MNRLVLGAAAATAVVLAACGGDSTGAVDGPVLTSGGSAGGGDDAQVYGEIVLDGDCLLLEHEAGHNAVVWPAGTNWQAEPPAVLLPGGETVEIGGAVNGSGGYYARDQVESRAGAAVADAAAACAGPDGETAVFNPGSEVERGLP